MDPRRPIAASDKGKAIATDQVQITREISDLTISDTNTTTTEAGWEVISKKSKNRTGPTSQTGPGLTRPTGPGLTRPSAPNAWSGRSSNGSGRGYPNPNPVHNPWPVTPDPRKKAGRGNPRPQLLPVQYTGQPQPVNPVVQPPLAQGWNWAARARPAGQPQVQVGYPPQDFSDPEPDNESDDAEEEDDDDDDLADDSDDDLSDDYDSDTSRKSFGTRKQNKWFKTFFDEIDKLSVDEINGQTRQWHCPACANGPGAIEWYRGLQPLMTHAKTKGATRVKLHRELASLLEEELRRRGTSVIPVGEQFGKWKGLNETTTDHLIVWPPMVVIMNTTLDKDDNDKFIGMGNQELLDYFSTYAAKKARHSYGPRGHRGMSLLIFDSDAVGYLEAERLHKHFESERTDRDAWDRYPRLFLPGGKRQLYGFLAKKEDLDCFNQHCQGKSRLKFEMKSYQEMVVGPMRQMNEDNQQLHWLQRKVVKQEQRSKVIEQSFEVVSKRLRDSAREIALVRGRTRKHHEETKEEMAQQEHFFKDQIDRVQKAIEDKERDFEDLLQTQRARATASNNEDQKIREDMERFIASQDKGLEEFVKEKDELIKAHEEEKMTLRREFLSKEVELERKLDASLTALMEKFKASTFHASSSSSSSS
ncbi:hypothetical protein LUZ60_007666 [Juncus effusus]|nr:hypothetical protein LUZ60_007666 [Juncus effusus]